MPTYEYECSKCGEFEVEQRITEAPLQKCPKCRRKVRKLISRTSFQLKGSGWYITDYARKGSSDSAGGEAAKGADGKGGDGKAAGDTSATAKSAGSDKAKSKEPGKTTSKAGPAPAAA